jgi:hypothetical protein
LFWYDPGKWTEDGTVNLAQARTVMDRWLAAPSRADRPRYGDFYVAGQVIAKHYRDHPEQLKPVFFTDAKPRAKPRRQETAQETVARLADEYHRSQRDQAPRTVIPTEIEQGRAFDPTLSYGKL